MNKNFVRTLALVGMVGMMSSTGLVAHAAEAPQTAQTQVVKQNLNREVIAQVFDAKYYAEAYPDVVAALGNDSEVLLSHYMNNGIYEGRDASATFNASVYSMANSDLVEVFGDDINALIKHYIDFGINEKRVATMDAFVKTAGVAAVTKAALNTESAIPSLSESVSKLASTVGSYGGTLAPNSRSDIAVSFLDGHFEYFSQDSVAAAVEAQSSDAQSAMDRACATLDYDEDVSSYFTMP